MHGVVSRAYLLVLDSSWTKYVKLVVLHLWKSGALDLVFETRTWVCMQLPLSGWPGTLPSPGSRSWLWIGIFLQPKPLSCTSDTGSISTEEGIGRKEEEGVWDYLEAHWHGRYTVVTKSYAFGLAWTGADRLQMFMAKALPSHHHLLPLLVPRKNRGSVKVCWMNIWLNTHLWVCDPEQVTALLHPVSYIRTKNSNLIAVLWKLNEIIYVKCLKRFPQYNRYTIHLSIGLR